MVMPATVARSKPGRSVAASSSPIVRSIKPLGLEQALLDEGHHVGVVGRCHPVAAQHVQLPADDPLHRHSWVAADRRQQPYLHVATPTAEAEDRVGAGLLGAHGVHRDVAAASGEVGDRGRDVRAVGTQHVRRAEVGGDGERLGVPVHRDHAASQRASDHHRAESHAAGADHGHPLTLGEAGASDEGAVRRGEPAPEAGGGREVDRLGDGDQVGVRGVQRDVLGERSPVGEARLLLVRAHLGVPGQAPLAPTAAADERHGHPVADGPPADALADLDHHAGQLMTRHVREGDLVVSRPRVPVAPAHSGGHHADHHAAGRSRRIGHHSDLRTSPDGIDNHSAHHGILSPRTAAS